MCKGPGTREALLLFTLHNPAMGKPSLKSPGPLAQLLSGGARSALTPRLHPAAQGVPEMPSDLPALA